MARWKDLLIALVVVGILCHEVASIVFPKYEKISIDERRQRLAKSCAKQILQRSYVQITKTTLDHILVNDEHGVLYCYVPKVACSNWKRVMAVLDGKANSTDEIGQVPHSTFKRLSRYPPAEIQYRLENYYKFMFAREPLQRVVSAYKDKLTGNNEYYATNFVKQIISKFRPSTERGASVQGPGATLEEFFMYLGTMPPLAMDEHWMPMNGLCQPCAVQYDYIGTLENVEEDSKQVIEEMDVDKLVRFPRKQKLYKNRNGPSIEELLNQLPKKLIKNIIDKYHFDYELFGYSLPDLN